MSSKQHVVRLGPWERDALLFLGRRGRYYGHDGYAPAWAVQRAIILLKADIAQGGTFLTDGQIAEQLDVSPRTVARVRAAWCSQNLGAVGQWRRHHPPVPAKLSEYQQFQLINVLRSQPPEGYSRWSLRLLAKRVVELGIVGSISHETLRQTLIRAKASNRYGGKGLPWPQ